MKMTLTRTLQSAAIAGAIAMATSQAVGLYDQGAEIVAKGTAAGAIACARCHAFDGNSDGSGAFPALAGQTEFYLQKQLRNYASGTRKNPIMSPIAAKLTADEITAVTRYYARLAPRAVNVAHDDEPLVARGQELAVKGTLSERVEACQSCHGPNGEGEAPDVPRLAGQYGHYIAVQLQMLQRGYRNNDPGGQMRAPSHNLNTRDISAVSAYYAQLPVPNTQAGGSRNGR